MIDCMRVGMPTHTAVRVRFIKQDFCAYLMK